MHSTSDSMSTIVTCDHTCPLPSLSCFTPQEGGACRAAATKISAGVLQHCMELQGDTLVSDWCVSIGNQGKGAGKVFHLPCPKARMFLKTTVNCLDSLTVCRQSVCKVDH